jgi:ABC-2 type transport system ATP-binding protein
VTVATPDDLTERGTDEVTLTLDAAPAATPTIDDDRVDRVTVDGSTLTLRASSGSEVVPVAVRQLEAAGHRVLDVDVARTSLEDVFVDITRTGGDATDGSSGDHEDSETQEVAP